MSQLSLLYVHSEHIGYGRFGVKLSEAIERSGVEIFDDLPNPASSGAMKFIPHANGKSRICGHVSWFSTPGHCRGWWKGQTKSLFSMWESSVLPEPFRESFDAFDTIVCPSEQNQELFGRYHNNVHYVPLGIDPKEWHPLNRPSMDKGFFNFFISGGGQRKGSDLVIEAFRKVFATWPQDMPIPRLIVHTAKASEIPMDDRIELITGYLTPEEERELYASAHCFVFPSRGEGFGLRPLQAVAQGCPTIATDAHGHKAFSHLLNYPLPWTLEQTPPQSFHHGPAGSWWEPDFDALCQAMEDVYFNYDREVEVAGRNGFRACRELNWDETARKYLDAIGRDSLELPEVEPIEWIEPPQRRYLVRVNSTRMMEVGGLQHRMVPFRWEACNEGDEDATTLVDAFGEYGEAPIRLVGASHVRKVPQDYWESADVKRILFDGGHLDPSCLVTLTGEGWDAHPEDHAIDMGLTREQYEQIPNYSGSHSFCPTCSQKLNTNRMTVDDLLALPMPPEP